MVPPSGDLEFWAAHDPISRYRSFLQSAGVWNERLEKRAAAKSTKLRSDLRNSVIHEADIDVGEMFDSVYAAITPDLADQRDRLVAELTKEM